MCGLFGIFYPPGRKIDISACRRAINMQRHRGPDAYGEWVSESGEVFLGHRRLSIIDLSAEANQPMASRSGNILIYNGEIYNFQAIRNELTSLGYRFKSSSDTEVLLNALEAWGTDCLDKLEGMFAFVLWRPAQEEAVIVRDYYGIKPLYYWRPPFGGLAVSSEIKSFYALPDFSPEIQPSALPEHMRFGCLCGEETLLKGVKKVKPGQRLRYERTNSDLRRHTWWDPFGYVSDELSDSEDVSTEKEFLPVFTEIVERHLIADVPVGTQFSGGIDSSLISAICRIELNIPLTGFFCKVEDSDYDETPFAEGISGFLGMNLRKASLGCREFLSGLIEKLTWFHDEPLMHPNSIGIYLVSEMARGEAKVLLSGECADEFFGGYSHYPLILMHQFMQQRPTLLKASRFATRLFPFDLGFLAVLRDVPRRAMELTTDEAIVSAPEFMNVPTLKDLLADSLAEAKSVERRLLSLPNDNSLDVLTRTQLFDVQSYIPMLLMRQDKMSMAASIENRVPFATPKVLSLAMRLRAPLRAGLISRKSFLKSSLKRYLPGRYVNRRKWGFGIPLNAWLRTSAGMKHLTGLTLDDSPLRDIMDLGSVKRLVAGFSGGDDSQARVLWALLGLKVWMEIFCTRKGRSWFDDEPHGEV